MFLKEFKQGILLVTLGDGNQKRKTPSDAFFKSLGGFSILKL